MTTSKYNLRKNRKPWRNIPPNNGDNNDNNDNNDNDSDNELDMSKNPVSNRNHKK